MKKLRIALGFTVSGLAMICAIEAAAATFDFSFAGPVDGGTITSAGTYRITLGGGTGGGTDWGSGGTGAVISGDIYLNAGQVFSVLVGGNGEDNRAHAGGGGLSYFLSGTDLAVAGGGGGSGAGQPGRDSTALGGSGNGGSSVYSGSGAGVLSDGDSSHMTSGKSGAAGWAGGTGSHGAGGFGGGGAGQDYGGGGGGGYTGGNGGYYSSGHAGTSFLGTNFTQFSFFGAGATSGGYVSVDLISAAGGNPSAIPLPGSAGLLGAAIGAGAIAARRKNKKKS